MNTESSTETKKNFDSEKIINGKTALFPGQEVSRWHDPLKILELDAPSQSLRIVLMTICTLILLLGLWASIGKLDIVATAQGKLVPQTLVKVVQPGESGIVSELLVKEGDKVKEGQLLARLDATLTNAEHKGNATDLEINLLQRRRINAELHGSTMVKLESDDQILFERIEGQRKANYESYQDSVKQEHAIQTKLEHERMAALDQLNKLKETLPIYRRVAQAYLRLRDDGYMGDLIAAEKEREAVEKARDLDAQRSNLAALDAGIFSQKTRIEQLRTSYLSALQRELAELEIRITQLNSSFEKTRYRTGLMELRAPHDGVIKDLAITSIGMVLQPGAIVMTILPSKDALFADVNIRNEDVGFLKVGQSAQIKISSYPFQKYGILSGTVIRLGPDVNDARQTPRSTGNELGIESGLAGETSTNMFYKARIRLNNQKLLTGSGDELTLQSGMQLVGEINLGRRTVLEYLLSPIHKVVSEAGREK